jgi:hypothetical protein
MVNTEEPAMTQPLIDRTEIERTINSAKAARVRHFQQKSADVASVARWGGLTLLVASALAFFGSHGTGQAASDANNPGHAKFSRYY